MLRSFRRFFDDFLASADSADTEAAQTHRLQLATAALLIEMMRADFKEVAGERDQVLKLLEREFKLSRQEAERLADLGAGEADEAVSLYDFTRLLDAELGHADKIRVVELLWQVAYVDGRLDKYEEYLVRKVADLLHVSHRQMMQAKHRVLESTGSDRGP